MTPFLRGQDDYALVRLVDCRWNQIYPSMTLLYEKMISLQMTGELISYETITLRYETK